MTTTDLLQADASLEEALAIADCRLPIVECGISASNRPSAIENRKSLTRRERQILRAVVAGKTNKQIAQELCRSQRTVEYHRNRLMRKLNVRNIAELVKQAVTTPIQ